MKQDSTFCCAHLAYGRITESQDKFTFFVPNVTGDHKIKSDNIICTLTTRFFMFIFSLMEDLG